MTDAPRIGLLLDVDGPIASTRTRTMRVPTIAPDLVAIAHAGCPVVFNTGRSAAFLRERVIPELVAAGLSPDAPVWGVGEKGGTWFSLDAGAADPEVAAQQQDMTMRPPQALFDDARRLAEAFGEVVFFDETKHTMISIEQHVEVPNERFIAERTAMVAELEQMLEAHLLTDTMTIYPTVISIDVEHADSGKALGARRALALIRERMDPPRRWFTAGDSGQDYDMSAQLHEDGFETTHLDVRPHGEVPDVPFDVVRERPDFTAGVAEDDITARHLARIRAELGA